ncbi:hypothetical protein StoSoilB5_35490 [Arthrobacter sp. StoSoilB5]|nr:hypothetical protein StoSoilB5_35490 [Arthrobacter sp. StoSoilB5]
MPTANPQASSDLLSHPDAFSRSLSHIRALSADRSLTSGHFLPIALSHPGTFCRSLSHIPTAGREVSG